jgi:hypothetical protein
MIRQITGSCCRMPSEAEPPASDRAGVLVVADDEPYCFAVQRVQISRAFCVPAVARRIVIEQRCGPRSRCTAMRAGLRTLQPVRLKPKFSLVAPQYYWVATGKLLF